MSRRISCASSAHKKSGQQMRTCFSPFSPSVIRPAALTALTPANPNLHFFARLAMQLRLLRVRGPARHRRGLPGPQRHAHGRPHAHGGCGAAGNAALATPWAVAVSWWQGRVFKLLIVHWLPLPLTRHCRYACLPHSARPAQVRRATEGQKADAGLIPGAPGTFAAPPRVVKLAEAGGLNFCAISAPLLFVALLSLWTGVHVPFATLCCVCIGVPCPLPHLLSPAHLALFSS